MDTLLQWCMVHWHQLSLLLLPIVFGVSAIKWDAVVNSRGTVLTTELNSLTNGSSSAAGSQLDNSSNLDQYAIAVLTVTFGSAPTAGGVINLFAVYAPDGTNYESSADTALQLPHALVATFTPDDTTAAQRLKSRRFSLDPAKTKFIVENACGQSFPSSGSTVEVYTFNDEGQ